MRSCGIGRNILTQETKFKMGDSVTARYDDKVVSEAVVYEHQLDPATGVDFYFVRVAPAPFEEYCWLAESTLTLND